MLNELWKMTAHQVKEGNFNKAVLAIGYDTIVQVIYDLVESVIRNGINTIILINGHDGNISPIDIASRKIKEKYMDANIVSLDQWWITAGDLLPEGFFEVWDGAGHAGECESSIAYYLFPNWCEPEIAVDVIPEGLPDLMDVKWDFSELTDTANTGAATKATAEKGKAINDVLVDYCVKSIRALEERGWKFK